LARVVFADNAAQSDNSQQLCSVANTDSANAAAHDAANSADISAHDAANATNIFFTAKSVAVFIAAAVVAIARSTAAWLSKDRDK
jgi:hypothetical protein